MARTTIVAGVEVGLDHWIGGERVGSAATFTDVSPIDEEPIADVARGGAEEAKAAVAAARAAFPAWAATPPAARADLLDRIADRIEADIERLAAVETTDNGSLLRSHRRGVMPRVVHNFRYFAQHLRDLSYPDFDTRGHTNHVSWDPSGVAVLITPWNAPLMLATWKAAPALAAGCTVVLKPAEWSPLTASLLADLAAEAGLPAGVLNVVQGIGEEVGPALVGSPDIARISFTGSTDTARQIGAEAARNLTPVSFELGGKSPMLVFADCDLDAAVEQAIGQYDNAGQVCLAGTRLLVEESIHDEFLTRFVARAAQLRQGDPRDEHTDIGPLVSREHFARVDGFVRRALDDGARAVLGGGPNTELSGLYYRPTLFTDVPDGAEILAREVFGPVLTLQHFRDEEEAIARANSTEYGLAAIVYTGDRARAERVSRRLVAGTVWVNCFFVRDLRAPFGGARRSGIGREGGTWSFDFYCDVKNTVTAPTGWSA
jgi:aminomuconate-semialdehyde/2-hydroxymuconate-6-semialdehyde dehydrogenase